MKFINDIDIPTPVFKTIEQAAQSRPPLEDAAYSVTELLMPPQMLRLQRAMDATLEIPISRKMWAVLGKALHQLIAENDEEFSEHRVLRSIDGFTISGTIDWGECDRHVFRLNDWKMSSVWTYVLEPHHLRKEWIQQLNCYRYLFGLGRKQVCDELSIVCHFRDWRRSEQRRNPAEYPPKDIMKIDVPIWSDEDTLNFIRNRIVLHEMEVSEPCSKDETWLRGEKWAVMKDGRKTALRVLDTNAEAIHWMQDQKNSNELYIEHRPGEPIRCVQGYCDVAGVCPQHAKWMEEHDTET